MSRLDLDGFSDVFSIANRQDLNNIELFAQFAPSTSITYDGSQRVATYIKDGVLYTCSYYTSGNGDGKLATIVGGGITRTYLYNSDGLLTDEVVT